MKTKRRMRRNDLPCLLVMKNGKLKAKMRKKNIPSISYLGIDSLACLFMCAIRVKIESATEMTSKN
jgi:hypothetical protein